MRLINTIRVYAFIVRMSFENITRLNLGDIVLYDRRRCVVTQGVNRPLWHMHDVVTNERHEYVHEDDFSKERSISNCVRSFKSTFRFYDNYWASIWIREPEQMRRW